MNRVAANLRARRGSSSGFGVDRSSASGGLCKSPHSGFPFLLDSQNREGDARYFEVNDLEVSVMFKWMQSLRRRRESESVPESSETERDSGEEEYESHEEESRESAPSGLNRLKTDDL